MHERGAEVVTESPLDLTIIIANYNTRELLRSCIESVYQHTAGISFEVICVDDELSRRQRRHGGGAVSRR